MHNIAKQKSIWMSDVVSTAIAAHRSGVPCKDISLAMNVAECTLSRHMRKAGYSPHRGRWQRPTIKAREALLDELRALAEWTRGRFAPAIPPAQKEPPVVSEVEQAPALVPTPAPGSPFVLPRSGLTAFTRPDGISLPYIRSVYGEMRA